MLQQKLTAIIVAYATAAVMLMSGGVAHAQTDKPNILVIWGDDIGIDNVSAYNLGMMGYNTNRLNC